KNLIWQMSMIKKEDLRILELCEDVQFPVLSHSLRQLFVGGIEPSMMNTHTHTHTHAHTHTRTHSHAHTHTHRCWHLPMLQVNNVEGFCERSFNKPRNTDIHEKILYSTTTSVR